ncbi:MAG TPA: DUF2061 domain-containing protein [Xanthobacteraceae bacterium]|jgi:uncharacterized membrane protein|nr:DUF2061 domain-containing protein [Xanthobacteraceae bacterium]
MNKALALGLTALAGAAVIEAALIPGLVIGGAAVLAPKLLPNIVPDPLPMLRRQLGSLFSSTAPSPSAKAASNGQAASAPIAAPNLHIKKAVGKTITFRIIVTALDFTSNLVVIGEAGTAAGLSTFALVVGPVFYLGHEAAWNYFGAPEVDGIAPPVSVGGFTMSRALAKTITFRTIATAMDFTTLYVVVGDLPTAIGLAAWGFVVGPFVYWGHEKAWDYYSGPSEIIVEEAAPVRLLPSPA